MTVGLVRARRWFRANLRNIAFAHHLPKLVRQKPFQTFPAFETGLEMCDAALSFANGGFLDPQSAKGVYASVQFRTTRASGLTQMVEPRPMPLTRNFKELVAKWIASDPAFGAALLREGLHVMLAGDVDTGKDVLRNYIIAHTSRSRW